METYDLVYLWLEQHLIPLTILTSMMGALLYYLEKIASRKK